MIFVGVDPGFTGAIAFLQAVEGEELAEVHDMPTRTQGAQTRIDRDGVVALLTSMAMVGGCGALFAVVEAVGAMGGKGRKEGTSSMFRFGQGQGEILGVLSGLGATTFEIVPQTWKAKCGLIGMDKRAVCKHADRRFPGQVLWGPGNGKNKAALHGRAEALFLAAYARMLVEGKDIYS